MPAKKIPVLFTPGVNHTTVGALFRLMIALPSISGRTFGSTKRRWKRITGNELFGKTIAVLHGRSAKSHQRAGFLI